MARGKIVITYVIHHKQKYHEVYVDFAAIKRRPMSPFARSRGRFCPGKPEALQQARHDIVSGEDRQRDAGQRRVAGG